LTKKLGIAAVFEAKGIHPSTAPYEIGTATGSPIFFTAEVSRRVEKFFSFKRLGFPRPYSVQIVDACGRSMMAVKPIIKEQSYWTKKLFRVFAGAQPRVSCTL